MLKFVGRPYALASWRGGVRRARFMTRALLVAKNARALVLAVVTHLVLVEAEMKWVAPTHSGASRRCAGFPGVEVRKMNAASLHRAEGWHFDRWILPRDIIMAQVICEDVHEMDGFLLNKREVRGQHAVEQHHDASKPASAPAVATYATADWPGCGRRY